MKNYDIYGQARDTAWRFLIENKINALPVKLSSVCRHNGIILLYDSNKKYLSENEKGVTFIDNSGRFNIILNTHDSITVQRYTTAHELGHIFLKHLMTDGKYGRTFGIQLIPKSSMEYQAERFAIDILAPACVLWGLNLHTAKDISEVCNISMRAAQIRAERMEILYKRNKFLTSPLERQVFEQFSNFINQHRLR